MCVPRIPAMPWFFTWRHWMTGLIFDKLNPNLQKAHVPFFAMPWCHPAESHEITLQIQITDRFRGLCNALTEPMFPTPTPFPRISRVEANINRPGNFNRRHDHGTGTASFLASGLESWSCGILEVEVNDDHLTCFASHVTWRMWST